MILTKATSAFTDFKVKLKLSMSKEKIKSVD